MRWPLFYQNSGKSSFEVRVNAYSQAMEKLHEKYPQDHEATAFYALSLLAAAPPRDTTFANQKKALAVLNAECPLAPDNPGIPHYIIHSVRQSADGCGRGWRRRGATDRLRRRLRTRRTCRRISSRGSGCGRRTSRRTWCRLRPRRRNSRARSGHELHAMDFLNYAYLQVGEDEKAHAIGRPRCTTMKPMAGHDMRDYVDIARAGFPATYEIEMRHWKEAAALEPAAAQDAGERRHHLLGARRWAADI